MTVGRKTTTIQTKSVSSILQPRFDNEEYINFRLKMINEENRLETFKTWVFNDSKRCNKAKLAEAGFYFTGTKNEPDVVTCFLCSKILDGWEEDDDPWKEHINHAGYCEFAKIKKPTIKLTLQEYMNMQEAIICNCLETIADKKKKNVLQCIDIIKQRINVCKK